MLIIVNLRDVVVPRQTMDCTICLIKLWPKVDALICFHSDGFPYLNAWKYVKKHRPFLINNLEKQQLLWDRTVVYDILRRIKVPIAKHFMVFRDLNYLDDLEKRGFGKTYLDEGGFLPSFTDVQIITA